MKREFSLIFRDEGVIIFFLILCFTYPIIYALVYNTEVVRDVAVVVVDDDRSADSREFARMVDASPEIAVIGYACDMQEARDIMNHHHCKGIIHFPRDYAKMLGRGEQAHVNIYCDMGTMITYKQILTACTGVQLTLSERMQEVKLSQLPVSTGGGTIDSEQVALGNTGMGLASAVLPCILIMVIQQSMILGICMLHGGSRERRLMNQGNDPDEVPCGAAASIIGKALSYVAIYVMPTCFTLFVVPRIFDFPQNGDWFHIIVMVLPFLFGSAFMGQTLKIFVNDRESTFIAIVFTSILFVFLSGISWPRACMSPAFIALGNMLPSTWAANSYIAMMSNGAVMSQLTESYWMLWILATIFFMMAYVVEVLLCRRRYRRMRHYSKRDPKALIREEYRRQGVDVMPHDQDRFTL
ncbi:MAG: ABC transporter permease [Bacteroidales bacterium]|nr:ABC transporter permease [Candidatus Sodaliphilus aphodohippi]